MQPNSAKIAVVGAGAFGGWIALHLLRKGARVTLLDAWGPANSRSSSGGESRIIRATYDQQIYVELVVRSLTLWREHQEQWQRPLYRENGALWLVGRDGAYEKRALALLREASVRFEELSAAEAEARFPQIDFQGVDWVIFEPEAGYLLAREACRLVVETFIAEGGQYHHAQVLPVSGSGSIARLSLSEGASLEADQFVFACGPWMGELFPDLPAELITATRQEVFYFGAEASDELFSDTALPVWIDEGEEVFYGIPGNEGRGFKLGDHSLGEPFDPTTGDRVPSEQALAKARRYLARRFPALRSAPLLESRVCQYERSQDGHFIVDRHPKIDNLWIVGGGSGHGYKHGPALGERVAEQILGSRPLDALFRFRSA